MKIELLKNAFGSTVERTELAPVPMTAVPRKRRDLPVAARHLDTVAPAAGIREEALMAFAAAVFDPRRMTVDEFEGLIEIMYDGDQISRDGRDYLLICLSRAGNAGYGIDDDAPRDMLSILRSRADSSVAEMQICLVLESLAKHRRLAA